MTCSLSDAHLTFEASGIKIRAYEIDASSAYGAHDKIQVRVSRQAADYLMDNAIALEPISLYIDGKRIARGMVPEEDFIGYETDYFPFVNVASQRHILDYGTVDGKSEQTLAEIIEWIVESRDDPFGVITDVQPTGSFDLDAYARFPHFDYNPDAHFLADAINAIGEAGEWFYKAADAFTLHQLSRSAFAGYSLHHITPAEALNVVQKEDAFYSYIDSDGVFWIGQPQQQAGVYVVGPHDEMISLTDYAVAGQLNPVHSVTVIGGLIHHTDAPDSGLQRGTTTFRAMARAIRTDIDEDRGEHIVVESRFIDGERLIAQAKSKLLEEITGTTVGSLTINGFTGNAEAGDLRDIRVGHDVIVLPYNDCSVRDIDGGSFTVAGVQHRINTYDGWRVRLDVAHNRLNDDYVTTEFVAFDPNTGEEIDPTKLY